MCFFKLFQNLKLKALCNLHKMRLLVTGGCGFIGSHFINWVHELYPETCVCNIDRIDYCSSESNVANRSPEWYTLQKCDLTHFEQVCNIVKEFSPDVVVHFAAQSHVDNSFGNSLSFTMDNVYGTHSLIEACRIHACQLKKFIHISTDEVYGEVDDSHEGCVEKSLLNPTNPYASSKAAAEFIVRSYIHSFKMPVVITRGNNVFGPNQYPEKVIPKFTQQLLTGKPITIQGDGTTRRNFIYVDNVSSAVWRIIQDGEINEIYNIGSNDEYSVLEIAELLAKKCNVNPVFEYIQDRNFNDHRYSVNCDKLRSLGWVQSVSFEEGIELTVNSWKRRVNTVSKV
jgi:UDP-glucose 4,6-dehydratase